jgi:hypothetical protein
MNRRDHILQGIVTIGSAVLLALLARYGIVLPAPAVPPGTGQNGKGEPAPMPEPVGPKPDPHGAIAMIQFGNAGCSATVIDRRRGDGRYDVLTAAHCITGKPQQGTMRLRDGRQIGVRVVAVDQRADCCWLVTEPTTEEFPFARLAERTPQPGTAIWHAGYGVDVPGNTERGTLDAPANPDGQLRMTLSVSSGDSGGGIICKDDGTVVSCVCCTSARGRVASVWGASPEAIRRLKPGGPVFDEWQPIEIPVRPEPMPDVPKP